MDRKKSYFSLCFDVDFLSLQSRDSPQHSETSTWIRAMRDFSALKATKPRRSWKLKFSREKITSRLFQSLVNAWSRSFGAEKSRKIFFFVLSEENRIVIKSFFSEELLNCKPKKIKIVKIFCMIKSIFKFSSFSLIYWRVEMENSKKVLTVQNFNFNQNNNKGQNIHKK